VRAVEAVVNGQNGVMVGLQGREMTLVPLEEVVNRQRRANMEYYTMARMLAR
jgi:6-phosphofructokinase 1